MITAGTKLISQINRVFYYTDATGITLVGPTKIFKGGKNIGQENAPSRGKGEEVGIATGKRQQNSSGQVMVEVNWTNTYYRTANWPFSPGGHVSESKTSWVREAEVDYTQPAADPEPETEKPKAPATPGKDGYDPKNPLGITDPKTPAPESQSNNNTIWIIVGGAVLVVAAVLIYFRQPPKSRKR